MDYKEQKQQIACLQQALGERARVLGLLDRWLELNWKYFQGELNPCWISTCKITPYGTSLGHWEPGGRTILLRERVARSDSVLLHEMAHQAQSEWSLLAGLENEKDDSHFRETWFVLWNTILFPALGLGDYCIVDWKRTKRNWKTASGENIIGENGKPKQQNVWQMVWVPSAGNRIPLNRASTRRAGIWNPEQAALRVSTADWAKKHQPPTEAI